MWRAPPSLRSITVGGSRLILGFSEPIQFTSSVGARFAVTVAGSSRSVLASQAGATNSELLLTLEGPSPTGTQNIRVRNTDLSGKDDDSGVIEDRAGNDLASIFAPGRAADTVRSSVSVSALAATTRNLVLTGNRAIDGTGNNLAETITDFNPSQGDRIELENAVFTEFTRTGPLAPTAFRSGTTATIE